MKISVLCLLVLICALAVAHGAERKSSKKSLRSRLRSHLKYSDKGKTSNKRVRKNGIGLENGDNRDAGESWFPIKSVNTYQCATVHFNHKRQLNEVVQKPCEGGGSDGQKWVVRADRQIENKELAGNCLGVLKGRKAAGNKLVLTECEGKGHQWTRFEFTPLPRNTHQISFISKNWTYYCIGTNDFDHNLRIYGCDTRHPYQLWTFSSAQYLKIPRCNKGDAPEEQVRCGDNVYLYQANTESVSWVRMSPGDDKEVKSFAKLYERKAWKIECTLQKDGERLFESAGLCFRQNRRYLTLDGGLHWTQEKHCNLDLPDSWQNMRLTNLDDEATNSWEESNQGGIFYACRDHDDVLHNYVSLTGEYYGTYHDPTPVWMRIGADQRVSTSADPGNQETRIFLIPPGW